MNIFRTIVLLAIFLLVIPNIQNTYAAEISDELSDSISAEDLKQAVPNEAKAAVKGINPTDATDLSHGFKNLWELVVDAIQKNLKAGLRIFVLIMITALMMGLADGLYKTSEATEKPLHIAGILAIAAICFGDMQHFFGLVIKSVQQIEDYSKIMLPMLVTTTAAAGAPAGAISRHVATVLFSDILITIINRFMIPCTYLYLAAVTANSAIGNQALKGICDFIKWGISFLLKMMLTLYVAYLTVSGVISGTSDLMLEKGAKLAISGMIPVVGGIISDATQTIVVGAGILRNSIGIFGLLSVLGITLIPLVKLGINYLLYKLASTISSPIAPDSIMKYIGSLADVFGLMIGMTAAASLMLLIGIISCLQAGIN